MTRTDFTEKLIILISEMLCAEEHPLIDYVKRSDEEQYHLFMEGKSKCDGIKIKSKHQEGKAVDIYFVENGKLSDPKNGWGYWHNRWIEMGGKPMIEWDKGHFEV